MMMKVSSEEELTKKKKEKLFILFLELYVVFFLKTKSYTDESQI